MAKRFTVSAQLQAEDRASRTIRRVQGSFDDLATFLSSRFVFTLSEVQQLAEAAFDAIGDATRLRAQRKALREQVGDLDAFLAKLKEVSEGTVATNSLIQSSSRAILLGIPADQIAGLLETARVSAAATGETVAKAFDDIATGVGRASPLILDNLGFVIKLEEVYAKYATTVGKTTGELTSAEQRQALLNEVLEQGAERAGQFGDALEGLPTTLDQIASGIKNVSAEAKDLAADFAEGATSGADASGAFEGVVEVLDRLSPAAEKAGSAYRALLGFASTVNPLRLPLSVWEKLGETFGLLKPAAEEAAEGLEKAGDAAEEAGTKADRAATGVTSLKNAQEDLAQTQQGVVDSSDEFLAALSRMGVELEGNVAREIEGLNGLLVTADELLRKGEISARDYANIQGAIAVEQSRLNGQLVGSNAQLEQTTQRFSEAATAADTFATSTREATQAVRENAAAQRESGSIGSSGAILPGISIAEIDELNRTPGNTLPIRSGGIVRRGPAGTTIVRASSGVRGTATVVIQPDGTRVFV